MVIQINNASLKRDDTFILKNINWSVKPGQHWAIVGLNGSGKTTLLNIINGYIWPTSGEISVLGNKFGQCDLRQLRKSIGWVSSSLQERLYGDETAQEIVLSGKHASIGLYVQPDHQDIALALGLLEQMGCSSLANQPYKTLSQGEKQKILIARALISSPQLLILDEPCTGLDLFAREQFLDTVEKPKKSFPALTFPTSLAYPSKLNGNMKEFG